MAANYRLFAEQLAPQPPPPLADDERAEIEKLLRRARLAVQTLKEEAKGLANAREQYRRRFEGPRGQR